MALPVTSYPLTVTSNEVPMPKHIVLIITGSIAAYKSLDLLRQFKQEGHEVSPVLTKGAEQFVTPLSVAALCGKPVYDNIFSLKDEIEMGHIRLARDADLIVVAPATADILAKMTHGLADDLATSILLATDKPVLVAPAMNTHMWEHKATKRNVKQLQEDGIHFVGPAEGELACGEVGYGRMVAIEEVLQEAKNML